MTSERAQRGGGRQYSLSTSVRYQGTSSGGSAVRPDWNGYGNLWPGPGGDWFGPSVPIPDGAPPDVAGRRFDFIPGYNLTIEPRTYEPIGFRELQRIADGYDLIRLIIEDTKDQLEALPWKVGLRDEKAKPTAAQQARIDKLTTFWTMPDKRRGWRKWLRELIEDLLVIDAPTVFVRRTRGGDVYALEVIDGATIKVVIDGNGYTPPPPEPAYQQILHGIPSRSYTTDELLYYPRNTRASKVYGFGPVEQTLATINIGLRRQYKQLAWHTEGNMPEALIGTPDQWTADQIRSFQAWFDSLLQGNLGERSKARFVPGQIANNYVALKEGELYGPADEWLVRVFCFALKRSPQPFIKMMNRATAQVSVDQAEEQGLGSLMFWIKDFVDVCNMKLFNETELEFQFLDKKELDPKVQADVLKTLTGSALMSLNEGREILNLDPDPSPEANMLGVVTLTGFMPLSIDQQIEQKQKMQDAFPPPPPQAVGPDGKPLQTGEEGGGDQPPKPGPGGGGKPPPAKPGAKPKPGAKQEKAAAPVPVGEPIPADRPAGRRARAALQETVASAFTDTAKAVAAQFTADATEMEAHKAMTWKGTDDDEPGGAPPKVWTQAEIDVLVDRLDLSGFDVIVDATAEDLGALASDTARAALVQVGVTDAQDLVDVVNERAVAFARDRAAELVGKRWTAAGELIDNPNAKFAITETTRDTLRSVIADGLEDNIGIPAIAANIETSAAFDAERAALVANTEVRAANSQGALTGYRAAAEKGIKVKKAWSLGPEPCPVCIANADQGPIPLDQDFVSGDDATPAHPRCVCSTIPVVEDEK